jgi:hypothetical protein
MNVEGREILNRGIMNTELLSAGHMTSDLFE